MPPNVSPGDCPLAILVLVRDGQRDPKAPILAALTVLLLERDL
jgi:hypothetical protein